MLVEAGLATTGQVDDALAEAHDTGERLGEVVVRRGWATEDDVAILLAEQWGLNYVASGGIWFESDALTRLSREDAQRIEALPTRIQDGHVVVAVAEPTEERLAELRKMIGDGVVVVVVPKTALQTALQSELLQSDASPAADEAEPHDSSEGDEMSEAEETGNVVPLIAPAPQMSVEAALVDALAEPPADRQNRTDTAALPTDGVAALAAQVRGVADAIAALAEYEQRVAELEAELVTRRTATAELETELQTRRDATAEISRLLGQVVHLLDAQA